MQETAAGASFGSVRRLFCRTQNRDMIGIVVILPIAVVVIIFVLCRAEGEQLDVLEVHILHTLAAARKRDQAVRADKQDDVAERDLDIVVARGEDFLGDPVQAEADELHRRS